MYFVNLSIVEGLENSIDLGIIAVLSSGLNDRTD
jgi:hypothetical protein